MGIPRTLPAVLATSAHITPVYSGAPIASASASILKGVATIVLGSALPATGYSGPNNAIQGAFPARVGQQVTLWAFGATFAAAFNGKTVSVIASDSANQSFSFYTDAADQASAADTAGRCAASPFDHLRAVRIECDQALSTALIYVGDLNLSSSQYMACLSLAGQLAIEVASENIPADRIFVKASSTSETNLVHVTLIY